MFLSWRGGDRTGRYPTSHDFNIYTPELRLKGSFRSVIRPTSSRGLCLIGKEGVSSSLAPDAGNHAQQLSYPKLPKSWWQALTLFKRASLSSFIFTEVNKINSVKTDMVFLFHITIIFFCNSWVKFAPYNCKSYCLGAWQSTLKSSQTSLKVSLGVNSTKLLYYSEEFGKYFCDMCSINSKLNIIGKKPTKI